MERARSVGLHLLVEPSRLHELLELSMADQMASMTITIDTLQLGDVERLEQTPSIYHLHNVAHGG
jgi:hypothetical protein